MSRFTLLKPASASGRVYKSYRVNDQKLIEREREAPGTYFKGEYQEFNNFQEMCDVLTSAEADGNTCIVRGDFSAYVETQALQGLNFRRTKFQHKNDPAGLQPANRDWVMIDIDKFKIPEEEALDPRVKPHETIEYLLSRLPYYFQGVSCWWQFSASQSVMPGSDTVSAHLFFLLDRQISDITLRHWAESQRLIPSSLPIDHSMFDSIQPHYIAPPRFVGLPDPLPDRMGVYKGERDRVVFDVPEEKDTPFTEPGGTIHTLVQTAKMKPYLEMIGDGPGQAGFNDGIKSTVGRYFQLHGHIASDIPLKTMIRRAVQDAPVKHDRPGTGPQSIEHYMGDQYLDALIRAIREKEHTEKEAKHDDYKEAVRRYTYIEDLDRFIDLDTMVFRTKSGITDGHAHQLVKLGDTLLADGNLRRVSRITYKPGAPEFCEDYDPDTGKIFRAYNKYVPPKIQLQDEKDAKWFVDHMEYICDGEAEAFDAIMDWLAHLVQFPDEKINFGILLQSPTSIGKSAILNVMSNILGMSNVNPNLQTSALMSDFTEWMSGKMLVCIEEIKDWEHKFKIYNHMKDLITGATVRINPKGLPAYSIPNRTNFFCLTNYEDAIPMDDNDRRFIIHFSKAKFQSKEYYDELYRRVDEYSGAVRQLLLKRDVSKFNHKGRAPLTQSKRDYLQISGSPLELWIRDGIEGDAFPFAVDLITTRDLHDILPPRFKGVSEQTLALMMRKLGAEKLGKKRLPHGRFNTWAVRNIDKWKDTSEDEIGKAYRKPIADQSGGGYYQVPMGGKETTGKREY